VAFADALPNTFDEMLKGPSQGSASTVAWSLAFGAGIRRFRSDAVQSRFVSECNSGTSREVTYHSGPSRGILGVAGGTGWGPCDEVKERAA
jgi:hypothetical protein